jgi:hypothetical protein
MIELRVIDRGFYGMEYQYRHHILTTDASGGVKRLYPFRFGEKE